MKAIATTNSIHVCPIHGKTHLISTQQSLTVKGEQVICVGDKTSCGATIIEGNSTTSINGIQVATIGAKSSHGGTIIDGNSAVTL